MMLNNSWIWLARVAKVAALLLFFVPWLAVSCNGQPLVEATGWQMVTGQPTVADQKIPAQEMDAAWWAIAGLVVIVAGLLGSFLLRVAKTRGRVVIASSLVALALLGGGMSQTVGKMNAEMDKELGREATEGESETKALERQLAAMMGQAIQVEVKPGFWWVIALLGVGAVCGVATQIVPAGRMTAAREEV